MIVCILPEYSSLVFSPDAIYHPRLLETYNTFTSLTGPSKAFSCPDDLRPFKTAFPPLLFKRLAPAKNGVFLYLFDHETFVPLPRSGSTGCLTITRLAAITRLGAIRLAIR
jgi:hypothetical protein